MCQCRFLVVAPQQSYADVTTGSGGGGGRKLWVLFTLAALFFVGCHSQQHLDPEGQRAWMLGSEGPEFKSWHGQSQIE